MTTVSGGEVTVVGTDVVVCAAVFAAVAAGNVFIIVSVRKIWCHPLKGRLLVAFLLLIRRMALPLSQYDTTIHLPFKDSPMSALPCSPFE